MTAQSPPLHLWKHSLASHFKDFQTLLRQFCKQLFTDELQTKASQLLPTHSCSRRSYDDVTPQKCGEQALCEQVVLFGVESQLVLLLADSTVVLVVLNRKSTNNNAILTSESKCGNLTKKKRIWRI